MGNTYRRFGPVNVLTTRTGGAVYVDTQICRVDLDFDVVIHFRGDKHGRERGVATVTGVERALAHQTVYTGFSTQPAVGVFAFDTDSGRFDARNVAVGGFHQLTLEAVGVDPAQVHTAHHFGPVLSFGTTGACLNFQVGVVRVQFAGEHTTEFQNFQLGLQFSEFGFHFFYRVFVVFFYRHVEQVFGICQAGIEGIDGFYHYFQRCTFLTQVLGTVGVVPDVWLSQFLLYFFEAFLLVGIVKDTP